MPAPKNKQRGRRGTGEIDVDVGNRLRAYRLDRSMSQDAVANKLGVSFQQIQKYEKGVNRISVGRLIQFCELLKVDPHDLIGWNSKAIDGTPAIDPKTFKLVREFTALRDELKSPIRSLIVKLIETGQ
jgi:transcriptional regulator with XRE-family HTH domain